MKTIYYVVTYNDGIKEFKAKLVEDNYDTDNLTTQLFEGAGIRNVKIFNSDSEYNNAKKQY